MPLKNNETAEGPADGATPMGEMIEQEHTMTNQSPPIPFTDDELRQVKERAEAATPGPWYVENIHGGSRETFIVPDVWRWRSFSNAVNFGEDEATARFVAHAREDIPALLATVDAYRERLDRSQSALRLVQTLITRCTRRCGWCAWCLIECVLEPIAEGIGEATNSPAQAEPMPGGEIPAINDES